MTERSLACPDWEHRIRNGLPLVPRFDWLDQAQADRAVAIFNSLKIPDVPGTPAFATAGGDWMRDIVRALFGSLDPVTRERWIRELFLLVPKKNAKTTGGSAVMFTALLINQRPRAEFLLVAPTQQIALLAFGQVTGMIDLLVPKLRQKFHVQDHIKKVTYLPTNATLQIKSFDPKVMTGVKPSGILIDELHVIAESADADRVIGQIRGGIVSQPEAFFAFITTQSERPPRGVFLAELAKARAIRDGKATGRMLPVLYEFPSDITHAKRGPDEPYAWENPKHWHMVTPNNGRSITVPRLVEDYDTAKLSGPGELIRWASQHLNIEVGLALRDDRWAGADHWEDAVDEDLAAIADAPGVEAVASLDELLDRCEVVCAGVDGGGLDDLLALALIGREAGSRTWLHWGHAWAHSSVIERRKKEASAFDDFVRQGDLTMVTNVGQDAEEVADFIARVDARGLLFKVGLDPIGIAEIVDALEVRGIGEDRRVGISQGWKLAGAIKDAERALAAGRLRHCGRPLMNWAIGNAKTQPMGNAVMITKQIAGSAKIDPLMALFNAVALMVMNPAAMGGPSVYESQDLLVL